MENWHMNSEGYNFRIIIKLRMKDYAVFIAKTNIKKNLLDFIQSIIEKSIFSDPFFRQIPKLDIYVESGLQERIYQLIFEPGESQEKAQIKESIINQQIGAFAEVLKSDERKIKKGNYPIHIYLDKWIYYFFFRYGKIDENQLAKALCNKIRHEVTHIIQIINDEAIKKLERRRGVLINKINKVASNIKDEIRKKEAADHNKETEMDPKVISLRIYITQRLLIETLKKNILLEGLAEFIEDKNNMIYDKNTEEKLYTEAKIWMSTIMTHYMALDKKTQKKPLDYSDIKFIESDKILQIVGYAIKKGSYTIGKHIFFQIVYKKIKSKKDLDMLVLIGYDFEKLIKEYVKSCSDFRPLICLHGHEGEYSIGDIIGKINQARKRMYRMNV